MEGVTFSDRHTSLVAALDLPVPNISVDDDGYPLFQYEEMKAIYHFVRTRRLAKGLSTQADFNGNKLFDLFSREGLPNGESRNVPEPINALPKKGTILTLMLDLIKDIALEKAEGMVLSSNPNDVHNATDNADLQDHSYGDTVNHSRIAYQKHKENEKRFKASEAMWWPVVQRQCDATPVPSAIEITLQDFFHRMGLAEKCKDSSSMQREKNYLQIISEIYKSHIIPEATTHRPESWEDALRSDREEPERVTFADLQPWLWFFQCVVRQVSRNYTLDGVTASSFWLTPQDVVQYEEARQHVPLYPPVNAEIDVLLYRYGFKGHSDLNYSWAIGKWDFESTARTLAEIPAGAFLGLIFGVVTYGRAVHELHLCGPENLYFKQPNVQQFEHLLDQRQFSPVRFDTISTVEDTKASNVALGWDSYNEPVTGVTCWRIVMLATKDIGALQKIVRYGSSRVCVAQGCSYSHPYGRAE